MAKLIDGKALAQNILLDLKTKIAQLSRQPGLAVILIGDDPASHLYVRNKKRAAEKIGISFSDYFCNNHKCHLGDKEVEILAMIDWLNKDKTIDGIIVQLPLPKKLDTEKIIGQIDPKKDVDGFHPQNRHNFALNQASIQPPLIGAVLEALKSTGENLEGKEAVIVSDNSIFSESLTKSLETLNLKTQIVSPQQKDWKLKIKAADVVVVILGRKNFIKKSMIKPQAIVIDIGTNLTNDNQWLGDVDPAAAQVASFITPVPGGIGPLTVAMLLKNTYELAKNNQ